MMKYLKYLFGIQLLLASIWCFYYLVYWAAFLLLVISSIILMPAVYKLFKQKFKGFQAGCFTFLLFLSLFGFYTAKFLQNYFAPVETTISTQVLSSEVQVIEFEKQLSSASSDCFYSYDRAFSKSLINI